MTRVLSVDATYPQPEVIAEAAAVIRRGGLVAFPTETVYGLGADGLNSSAVQAIFTAKQRPANDPLILHLADFEQLASITQAVPETARILVEQYWPGPLTLVLPRAAHVPLEVSSGGPTVAARVPAHPVAQALIRAAGTPIAAPSANLFSRPSPTQASDVFEDLAGRIDLILDGGPTTIGVESTVLSLATTPPTLLRPGGLPVEAIEALIGPILLPGEGEQSGPVVAEGQAASAPGMLLKHYSPRARLLYLTNTAQAGEALIARMRQIAHEEIAAGRRLGLLLPEQELEALADLGLEGYGLGAQNDLGQIAARLFAGMRALDRAGVESILTHDYANDGLGRALNNRLYRAAEGRTLPF